MFDISILSIIILNYIVTFVLLFMMYRLCIGKKTK